jgi:repressor LexA
MGLTFDKKLFAQRLSECLDESGMRDYHLANYLRLSAGTISRYKAGDIAPKITAVVAMAEKFGVREEWLIGLDDVKYDENKPTYKQIPILGRIAAGKPLNVEEDVMGYEYVPASVPVDFALQVHGDSMIGARIFDKDIVFFRKQDMVETGEIAAVQIDGQDYTLKRVYYDKRTIELRAENPMYPPLVYREADRKEVRILGKAIRVVFLPK